MTPPNVRAVRSLAAACGLGLLGDLLLRQGPWSLNLAIWIIAALAIPPIVLRREGSAPPGGARYWLVATACVLAAGAMAMRASMDVWQFNLVALLTGLAVLLYQAGGGDLIRATPEGMVAACWRTAKTTAFGAVGLIIGDVDWRGASSGGRRVLVGLVIAVPVVVVFGALLAGGDPAFAAAISVIDLPNVVSHLLLWGWFSWIVAGYLRGSLVRPVGSDRGLPVPPQFGAIEVRTLLVAVALLFALFVAVQVRTLFGGVGYVTSVSGLTFAEYARQGFFQLVAVGALTLALLLGIDWGGGLVRGAHAIAWGILALLGLILVSAGYRMALYVSFYGLSPIRLYATMAIGWIAVASAWLGATVLRGRRDHFVAGALAAAVIWLAAVDLGNPEALVVRVNVARAVAGAPFDAAYLTGLSADAVPALVAALPTLPAVARCDVLAGLDRTRWRRPDGGDWRTWNLSERRAGRLVTALGSEADRPKCSAAPVSAP